MVEMVLRRRRGVCIMCMCACLSICVCVDGECLLEFLCTRCNYICLAVTSASIHISSAHTWATTLTCAGTQTHTNTPTHVHTHRNLHVRDLVACFGGLLSLARPLPQPAPGTQISSPPHVASYSTSLHINGSRHTTSYPTKYFSSADANHTRTF